MNLTVRLFGRELLHVTTDTECYEADDAGDCTTTPIGFGGYHGDQRWDAQPGVDC